MKNNGEILAEILREIRDCYFFLHNTKELSIVKKIMEEGLIYESRLLHTTDRVNPSRPVEITYFMLERKEYGNFTIVIAVPEPVFDSYNRAAERYNTGIEEIMTITEPYYGNNEELVYTLSPRHVLGYFDSLLSGFTKNPRWDPSFNNTPEEKPSGKYFAPGKYR